MKTIFTKFAAASLMLAAVGCQNEDMLDGGAQNGISVERVPLTISATLESDQTKTSLQEGGKVYWENGDAMTVLAVGEDATVTSYKFTTTDEGAEATFTNEDNVTLAENYYAVYPHTDNTRLPYLYAGRKGWEVSVVDSKLKVYFPSMQKLSPIGESATPLDAYSVGVVAADGTVAMKNLGGLIEFNIPETGVEHVILYGNAGEDIVGNAYVIFGEDGLPVISSLEGSNMVRVVPAAKGSFAVGKYYINVLPVTFSAGLTVVFTKTDGTWAQIRSGAQFVVERSKISPLPEISGLTFGGKVINLNAVNENGVAANPFTTNLPSSSASDVKGLEKSYTTKAAEGETGYEFKFCGTLRHYRSTQLGWQYGKGVDDYLEVPAIEGYALNKVVVRNGSEAEGCGCPVIQNVDKTIVDGCAIWDGDTKPFGIDHVWSFAGKHNTPYRIARTTSVNEYTAFHQVRLYYAEATAGESSFKPLITSVTTAEPETDPTNGKATLNGTFTAVDCNASAVTCGFDYKLVSEQEWTTVACPQATSEFSYELTASSSEDYVYRAWTKVNATGKTVYGSELQFNPCKLVLHLVFHGQEGRDLLMTQWGWKTNGNNSSTKRGYDMNGLSYNFTYNGVDYPFTFWALQSGFNKDGVEATSGGYCFRHTDNVPNEALCLSNLGKDYAPEGHPAWMQFPGPAGMKLIEVDAELKNSFSGHICTAVNEDGTWSGESLATYSKNSSFPITLANTSAGVRYYLTTEHLDLPRMLSLTLTYLYVGE